MLMLKSLLSATFFVFIQTVGRRDIYADAASMIIASAEMYQPQQQQGQPQPQNMNYLGQINFTQDPTTNLVHITGRLSNIQQIQINMLGFHIHQYGTTFSSCMSAGLHYNPTNQTHGAPWDSVRHVGDLGNINRTDQNSFSIDVTDPVIKLTGPQSIVGRSLVLHMAVDDYGKNASSPMSSITGNAGGRVGCGVIGIVSDFNVNSASFLAINRNQIVAFVAIIFATARLFL